MKLVAAVRNAGIDLKQTFVKEIQHLSRKVGRYAHVCQFKRMRRAIKRQCTIVDSLQREVQRKASAIGVVMQQVLADTLKKVQRIVTQSG